MVVPEAKLLTIRSGAGRQWWETYLNSRWADVDRRFQETPSVYWEPASAMPIDLFAYLREAQTCFSIGRFLAALSASGALAEIVLNRDPRLSARDGLRRIGGWILLNNENLAVTREAGLPVGELLDEGEDLHPNKPVRFVRSRNKVAHGDLAGYQADLPESNLEWEREARDQVKKATRFLVSWFNSSKATGPTPEGTGPV